MTRPITRALITGIGGQDGALLAARLLAAGAQVFGTHRPSSAHGSWRLDELGIATHPQLQLHGLDPVDADACRHLIAEARPTAIFHLAGQSRVADSFRDPLASIQANAVASLTLLEAMRREAPDAHFVLAASAEMFGDGGAGALDETSPMRPRSPYGLSKLSAHAGVACWREGFGLAASSAILFNHESELRDPAFVTRKISQAAARIALGLDQDISLGNLDARRDFGYAPEYVAALARMAEREHGADYVLATGTAASIRDFANAAFRAAGIELEWQGQGADETARDRTNGKVRIRIDKALLRPFDAPALTGNAAKARRELGFAPRVGLDALAKRMVEADLRRER